MNIRFISPALVVLILITPSIATSTKWRLLKTTGVRYTNTFAEVTAFSGIACASECMSSGRCFVANFNSATKTCTMSRDASTFVSDVNWDSFIVEIGMLLCVLYIVCNSDKNNLITETNINMIYLYYHRLKILNIFNFYIFLYIQYITLVRRIQELVLANKSHISVSFITIDFFPSRLYFLQTYLYSSKKLYALYFDIK